MKHRLDVSGLFLLASLILALGFPIAGSPASAQVTNPGAPILPVAVPGGPYAGATGIPILFTGADKTSLGILTAQYQWSFGDGTTGFGRMVSHTYFQPGAYLVTLTVTNSFGISDSQTTTASIQPGLVSFPVNPFLPYPTAGMYPVTVPLGSQSIAAQTSAPISPFPQVNTGASLTSTAGTPASSASTASTGAGGPVAIYSAGWNLVAGPQGTPFSQAESPLYSFRPGDMSYAVTPTEAGVQAGYGYWAYFSKLTPVALSGTSTDRALVPVPAGQFVLVGNPSATAAVTIHDADYAVSWDPQTSSYTAVSSLAPGAAAWVYVANAGVVTLGP